MSNAPEMTVQPSGTLAEIESALEALEVAPPGVDLEAQLLQLVGAEMRKADGIAALMQAWYALAESCEQAAERLRQRAERFERRRERLAAYVASVMEAHGLKKLEGERHTITLLPGRERVEVGTEDMIPTRYMVQSPAPPPRPDKRAIADAIKRGEDVPGARLVQGAPTVRIYQ